MELLNYGLFNKFVYSYCNQEYNNDIEVFISNIVKHFDTRI